MKGLKKIISAIIILIIIILIILLRIKSPDEEITDEIGNDSEGREVLFENTKVSNNTMFYTVSNCVQKYLTYCSINVNEEKKVINIEGREYIEESIASSLGITDEGEKRKVVYSLLEDSYINDNDITLNNLYDYVEPLNGKIKFTALKMRVKASDRIQVYSVYGRVENEMETQYKYFLIILDEYNSSFAVRPLSLNFDKSIDDIVLETKMKSIELNEKQTNKYSYNRVEEPAEIATKYFTDYKTNALAYIEDAYNSLDEEYRKKRFGNIELYKDYISSIEISNRNIAKYQVVERNGYTQYICIDNYGNYYIFNVTAPMEYTVMLDTYTIPQEEFLTKYNEGTTEIKVGLNVEKWIEMINTKDYKAAYAVLSDGFKSNYFPTEELFKSYMETHFYKYTEIEHLGFSSEGGVYVHKIKIKNKMDNNSQAIEKSIIMKLNSGTDFEMSFNVQ